MGITKQVFPGPHASHSLTMRCCSHCVPSTASPCTEQCRLLSQHLTIRLAQGKKKIAGLLGGLYLNLTSAHISSAALFL